MYSIINDILLFVTVSFFILACSNPNKPEDDNKEKTLKIVYIGSDYTKSDIYIIDISGENKLNLTTDITSSAINPVFSSKHKKIIFSSRAEYLRDQIFSLNLDGSGLRNLLNNNGIYAFFHDVSQERSRIVFGDGHSENIWIMDIDGNNQKNLTNSYGNWYPKFSPDGRQIVFQKYGNYYHDNIYTIDADGNDLTQLTDNTREDAWPQFTQDGSYILYLSTILYPDTSVDYFDIYRINLDGSGRMNITSDIGPAGSPASSPDGKKVLFTLMDENDIYIMDINGQNKTNLSNGAGKDGQPQFSPDMDKIVFISEVNGNKELFIMDIDGSNRTRLTNTTLNESGPIFCY